MASVNKVIIVGNLGNDPEIRQFDNGGMIATISVATSDRWTDRNTGEQREQTEWHRITFNNRLAEIARDYLRKGSSVYVEGSLHTRKWQDPQTGQDRYSTEIRANSMQMLGSRPNGQGGRYEDEWNNGGYANNARQNSYPNQGQNFNNQNYNGGQGYNQRPQNIQNRGNGGYNSPMPNNAMPNNNMPNSYQNNDMNQAAIPNAPMPNVSQNGNNPSMNNPNSNNFGKPDNDVMMGNAPSSNAQRPNPNTPNTGMTPNVGMGASSNAPKDDDMPF